MARALVAGVLVFVVLCAPARAATVATSGAFTLQARETGGKLCMTLRRDRHYQGQACGRIPRSPQRALRVWPDVGFENYAVAVPRSVAFAETETRSGERVRHRTFGARGFSARFVLIPASLRVVFVRFYAADGALLGIDGGPAGYRSLDENLTPVFEESIEARTEPQIAPTPDQPDRVRSRGCVDITNRTGGSGMCDDDGDGVAVMGSCAEPDLMGAIVGPGVASVRLVLGSGAQFVAPARELPTPFGGRRAIGARLPAGEAVRAAEALDAAGTVVARVAVGLAPSGQPCGSPDQGDDRFGGSLVPVQPPPGAVEVAKGLLAADQGEGLCVGLGSLPAANCPLPPADSDEPLLFQKGATVAGVLSRDAARITLELERGKAITVPTTDGPAYHGRWAGKVRWFAARVAGTVTRAVVRDAHGTIIGISAHGIPRPHTGRRVLAERDGLGVHLVRGEDGRPCVTAFASEPLALAPSYCTDPNPGIPIDGPVFRYSAAVTVACTPRRALAYGRMPDREALPRVLLDGDRTIRARRIALAGDDAWVALLPDAGVRGVQAGKNRVALRLPPASRQCGYSLARSL